MTDVTVAGAAALTAARGTREEEFRAFYALHHGAVARYVYHLTRDEELARDLAQEAFVRVYVRWVRVREPRAYLFHAATNLVRNAWRDGERHRRALPTLGVAESVPAPDTGVADAINRLPDRLREVVLLHYYADLPVAEIAAAVRRPAGTVKWLLAEARARLARSLEDVDA